MCIRDSYSVFIGAEMPIADKEKILRYARSTKKQIFFVPTLYEPVSYTHLYLLERFQAASGEIYEWTGAISGETFMTAKLNRFGYITLTAEKMCIRDRLLIGH